MTPGEFKDYAKTMCDFGISSLKMGNDEIIRNPMAVISSVDIPNINAETSQNNASSPGILEKSAMVGLSVDPIQHKTEQLASLLKLSDTDLVDQLFPDHRTNTEASER
jgi:hypothetical protein